MTITESWAFQSIAIMSGTLGVYVLDASLAMLNFMTLMFMFPMGISEAGGSLVGNALGEGKPGLA